LVYQIFFGIHAQNGKEGMHLKCGLELMNRVFYGRHLFVSDSLY